MELIFVRHGETDGNKEGILQGQSYDVGLNKVGVQQVEELIPELEKLNFDLIFSSPLKRARDSAEIIGVHFDVPIELDDNLMERDFGSLGGRNRLEVSEILNMSEEDFRVMLSSDTYDFRTYGGESEEDVKRRVLNFLERVKADYLDKKILVVTHGGIILWMHRFYSEEPYDPRKKLPNASVHLFEI